MRLATSIWLRWRSILPHHFYWRTGPVSYTHLYVYKRQALYIVRYGAAPVRHRAGQGPVPLGARLYPDRTIYRACVPRTCLLYTSKTGVSEAVTNAIVHGYADKAGFITVAVRLLEGRVLELKVCLLYTSGRKSLWSRRPNASRLSRPARVTGKRVRGGIAANSGGTTEHASSCTDSVLFCFPQSNRKGDRPMSELPKTYDPKSVADQLYSLSLIHI